jgi:transposase
MPHEQKLKRQQHIWSMYKLICSLGEKSQPTQIKILSRSGRYKETKTRNLVERLISEQDAVLAFAFNKNFRFTNNLVERDIKPTKVKQKTSNCFRTVTVANIHARIEGFVSTVGNNNSYVFSELCATFECRNFITA